jgi:multiple antibiotic resistance protein
LFSIVNPIGNASIFLGLTQNYTRQERYLIAYRVVFYGIILLVATLFLGQAVLLFFGISMPLVQIAGGILVFFTAWEMMSFKSKITPQEKQEAIQESDIAFFPLTMPLTAGAGSIAITITVASHLDRSFSLNSAMQYCAAIMAILAVFVIVGICYRFSDSIFVRLGRTGASVVTRLSAFILLAIGVSLTWDGLKVLILSLH